MTDAYVIDALPHADRSLRRRARERAARRPRRARRARARSSATALPEAAIEEVVHGLHNQAGEDNRNVARMASLLAGLPVEVPGVTVNRLCASGLEAVSQGARQIMLGDGDLVLAGGVESMTRAPLAMAKPDRSFPRGDGRLYDTTIGWRFVNPRMAELYSTEGMGETAENVAERYGVEPRRPGRVRAGEPPPRGRGAAGRQLRRRDRARAGPAAQGRPGDRPRRRAAAP